MTNPKEIDSGEVAGSSPVPYSAESALAEAMQDVWNDRALDCGEVPECFEIRGPRTTRVFADFEDSTFVSHVVQTLKARGYSILPNE